MNTNTSDSPLDSIPDKEKEKLQALAYADCMADQGRLDEAAELAEANFVEKNPVAGFIIARIQMLKAAKDRAWGMGIGAWELMGEPLVRDNWFVTPGAVRDIARFFLEYAEHMLAAGDRPIAVRYAKKAIRMNRDGNPEVAKRAAAVIGEG